MLTIDNNFWFTSTGTLTARVHNRVTGRVVSGALSEVGLRGRFMERYGILKDKAHTRGVGAVQVELWNEEGTGRWKYKRCRLPEVQDLKLLE